MSLAVTQDKRSGNMFRVNVSRFRGWSTRTDATNIADDELSLADNVVFNKDGLCSKRPGNTNRPGGILNPVGTLPTYQAGTNGYASGSGKPCLALTEAFNLGTVTVSLSGGVPSFLVRHDGDGKLYYTDPTNGPNGQWVLVPGSGTTAALTLSTTLSCRFTQAFDPDYNYGGVVGARVVLIVTDGSGQISPMVWAGPGTTIATIQGGAGTRFFPIDPATGVLSKPKYCIQWGVYTVYAGDSYGGGGLLISDALRPTAFTGVASVSTDNSSVLPYFPAGRSAILGVMTGLSIVNETLVIFYSNGIVAGSNTGTYGAFEFKFKTISTNIGTKSPDSIVNMEFFTAFYSGNALYATDGNSFVQLPDMTPTVYRNTFDAAFPAEIKDVTTVSGMRYGPQIWWSYYSGANPSTSLDRVLVFDTSANSGYSYGSKEGGSFSRWIGVNIRCGYQKRGPSTFSQYQMYWGDSSIDRVALHNSRQGTDPVYSDFGASIQTTIVGKAFSLDQPGSWKNVLNYQVQVEYSTFITFNEQIQPAVVCDGVPVPMQGIVPTIQGASPVYGVQPFGSFFYGPQGTYYILCLDAGGLTQQPRAHYIAPAVLETSSQEFNLLGVTMDVQIDSPTPAYSA